MTLTWKLITMGAVTAVLLAKYIINRAQKKEEKDVAVYFAKTNDIMILPNNTGRLAEARLLGGTILGEI